MKFTVETIEAGHARQLEINKRRRIVEWALGMLSGLHDRAARENDRLFAYCERFIPDPEVETQLTTYDRYYLIFHPVKVGAVSGAYKFAIIRGDERGEPCRQTTQEREVSVHNLPIRDLDHLFNYLPTMFKWLCERWPALERDLEPFFPADAQ